MVLNFVGPIQSESVSRLPLQTLIYEVSRFHAPSLGDISLFQLHLLLEDSVSDFFPVLARVRSFAHHELIAKHAQSEVIYCHAMILPAHDLRSHVARRARSVVGVVGGPNPGNAHVGDVHVALLVEQQVLRLDVSVDHAISMHIVQAHKYASHKELSLWLRELPLLR